MIAKKDIQAFNETNLILLRECDFVYLLPHHALQDYISNYTVTFPSKQCIPDHYTVIPHGSATLVFSHDKRGFHSNLFGPLTKPCMVGHLANPCNMLLIIEFQPAGLFAFTGVSQKELTNRTIPFEIINSTLHKRILEVLEDINDLNQLIGRLNKCLFEHLHTACPDAFQMAMRMILQHNGIISYKELSAIVHYSARHLNRMFEYYLGMSAKTFSRLIRINKAIRLIQNPQCSMTYASCETGFYDLPHLIHDFKSICGITPQEYRNNMSDFYIEIAKF